MEKVTKQEADNAAKEYLELKREKEAIESKMKTAQDLVEVYCKEYISDFDGGRLLLGSAIVKIVSGTAKPLKDGKALTQEARAEFVLALPKKYVKIQPECSLLYKCDDKEVRQIMRAHGIEIVKEDRLAIM